MIEVSQETAALELVPTADVATKPELSDRDGELRVSNEADVEYIQTEEEVGKEVLAQDTIH